MQPASIAKAFSSRSRNLYSRTTESCASRRSTSALYGVASGSTRTTAGLLSPSLLWRTPAGFGRQTAFCSSWETRFVNRSFESSGRAEDADASSQRCWRSAFQLSFQGIRISRGMTSDSIRLSTITSCMIIITPYNYHTL